MSLYLFLYLVSIILGLAIGNFFFGIAFVHIASVGAAFDGYVCVLHHICMAWSQNFVRFRSLCCMTRLESKN